MDEIKSSLLNKDLTFNRYIYVDVQEYSGTIEIENTQIDVYKRLYIDYIVKDINLESYVKINNEVLKVVKVKTYSDYQEVFVSKIENIKINNIDELAIVTDGADKIIDYKTIITDFQISTGDLIEYQGSKWLIIGEVCQTNTIYKAAMQKANHLLKMYIDNTLQEFPSIIEVSNQTIYEGNMISIVEGNIKVTIQDNSITNKIDYNNQFIKMGCKWNINGFTSEIVGIKHLYCSKAQFSEEDDKENEIANRWKHETKHNYIFTVEPKSFTFNEAETKQITVNVKDNNVDVVNPIITYVSNNLNIAIVDGNGLITGISEGNAIITVSFIGQDNKTYTEIINIVVKKVPIIPPLDIITYDMTNTLAFVLKKTTTGIFTAHKYLNGNETTAEFEFELDRNGLTTTQIVIVETTNTYIKIKNAGVDTTTPPKSIILRYREKGNIEWLEKEVVLKGIYG